MHFALPRVDRRRMSRLWDFLMEDVREDLLLEFQLLLISFATGIQDAATWPDYSCFASNQTGNTVFIAIKMAGLTRNGYNFSNIAMSLCLFIAGGFVMGQTGNRVGSRRRLWLLISNILQTALVYGAAMIQYWLPIRRDGPAALAVVALLAFSSGGQVAMSRGLKITEITTAMATAAYVDVVVDPKLFKLHNRLRNRRVLFLIMLALGSLVGAYAQREVSSTLPVLLCAIVKSTVGVGFLFNRPIAAEDVRSKEMPRLSELSESC